MSLVLRDGCVSVPVCELLQLVAGVILALFGHCDLKVRRGRHSEIVAEATAPSLDSE